MSENSLFDRKLRPSSETNEDMPKTFTRRRNLLALKAEQGITDDAFCHYDTPLSVKHEREALIEAGFSSAHVLHNWGATYTRKAVTYIPIYRDDEKRGLAENDLSALKIGVAERKKALEIAFQSQNVSNL